MAAQQKIEAEKAKAQDKEPELPENLKEEEDVYRELEKDAKYKGIIKKAAEFEKAELAYAEKWEAENPGQTFNDSDPEHAAWYEAHEPKVPESALSRARARVEARRIAEEEYTPKIKELEREKQKLKVEPVIREASATMSLGIIKEVDPQYSGPLSKEALEPLAQKDPVAFDVAIQVDNAFNPVAVAFTSLWNNADQFDRSNPAHVAAVDAFVNLERAVDKSGYRERGWVPYAEFQQMTPEQRQNRYTTTDKDVVRYLSNQAKAAYKQVLAQERERMKRYGVTAPVASNQSQAAAGAAGGTATKPAAPAPVVPSPSVGAGPAASPSADKVTPPSQPEENPFWSKIGV